MDARCRTWSPGPAPGSGSAHDVPVGSVHHGLCGPRRCLRRHTGDVTVAQAGVGVTPTTIYGAVKAGHPALVWVTFDWKPDARSDYLAYDGQTIPYAGPEEHAMVVTGINGNSVRVNDPDRGQYWVTFGQLEAAYAVYGQMALVFG